ncbi:MAG TPA: hypothetical protein VLX61_15030 [Anaerolineales bacterium]|nr:hypothetical protein [Anaerolineales bacterium]
MNLIFSFDGLLWFILTLLPLVFLQRLLHREIQAVILILSRSQRFTITLFSIIFLPGVLLHELSHYGMAVLLGVEAARFSLIPQVLEDGRLQLGYVETGKSDMVRDSLVGAAPLIVGGGVVALIALIPLHLQPMWDVLRHGQLGLFWFGLTRLSTIKDFPFWFYITFAVSSTMLPSQSDRHAWLPLGVAIGILIALAILAGIGPWMLTYLAPALNAFLSATAIIFGLSATVHIVLLIPVFLIHKSLARLIGVDIQ